MTAQKKLEQQFIKNRHICVGLDTDIKKLPKHLFKSSSPVLEFNKRIIEATYEFSAAYKINLAFYEQEGAKGFETLAETLSFIPPDILVIGDAKRGDIGNTSRMYAKSIYEEFNFDAVTLHPYMGYDSIHPFAQMKNKLNFILALTSNKSSADFEKLLLNDGNYLYQEVIRKVKSWNEFGNMGIVFGATNNPELSENVNLMKGLYVLLPGVGAQGGSLEDVVHTFKSVNHNKYIVNVSRAILYADHSEDFGEISRSVLIDYNKTVSDIYNS